LKTRTTRARAEIRTYARLFQIARHLAAKSAEAPEGSSHLAAASVVFSAFTIEALVSHFGMQRVPNWTKRERKLGTEKRLAELLRVLSLAPDMTQRPWSSATLLKELRDQLAHGWPRRLEGTVVDDAGPEAFAPRLLDRWEAFSNPGNANEFVADVREIAGEVHRACGLPEATLSDLGGFGGVSSWS